MQVSCEHCGRIYESSLTRTGGLERCPKCQKLNVFLPAGESSFVIFGDYIIQEKIGQGGNAYVVKAKHMASNSIVALKLFFETADSNEHASSEFMSEVDGATQLVHENIVRIYSGGERDGILFIVMEYVDGINLSEYLEHYGAMPPADAMAVGIHICYALDHVWSNFLMIHRDVKPQNIMITKDGNIKLCDFGLISNHELSFVDSDTILGTPYYVSPEMVDDTEYQDNRSDIYSLGATLYHVIGGVPPFNTGSLAEVLNARLTQQAPLLTEVSPHVPEGLAYVVAHMMAGDPDHRYATAREVAEDVLLVREGGEPNLVDEARERINS